MKSYKIKTKDIQMNMVIKHLDVFEYLTTVHRL